MVCKESKSTQNHNCLFTLAHNVLILDVPPRNVPSVNSLSWSFVIYKGPDHRMLQSHWAKPNHWMLQKQCAKPNQWDFSRYPLPPHAAIAVGQTKPLRFQQIPPSTTCCNCSGPNQATEFSADTPSTTWCNCSGPNQATEFSADTPFHHMLQSQWAKPNHWDFSRYPLPPHAAISVGQTKRLRFQQIPPSTTCCNHSGPNQTTDISADTPFHHMLQS